MSVEREVKKGGGDRAYRQSERKIGMNCVKNESLDFLNFITLSNGLNQCDYGKS